MRKLRQIMVLCALAVPLSALQAQTADKMAKPDNSVMNKGDQKSTAMTADKQKINAGDQKITRQIRRSIMADKSLSTYAHNIKIITRDGAVTLKGPVKSDDEKKSVLAKAVTVAGSADKVTDQITVTP